MTSSAAPVPATGSGPSPSLLLRFLFRAASGAAGASQGPGCRGHFGVLRPDGAVTVTTNAQQTPALRNRNLTCSTRPWDGAGGATCPSGLGASLLALTQLSRCASPWGYRYYISWGPDVLPQGQHLAPCGSPSDCPLLGARSGSSELCAWRYSKGDGPGWPWWTRGPQVPSHLHHAVTL